MDLVGPQQKRRSITICPESAKEHTGFPNIKEKLALELNKCCLGGSGRDVSGDKMSFQRCPAFVRASIRKLQRDPITAGTSGLCPVCWGPVGMGTEPIHRLCHSEHKLLMLHCKEHCSKNLLWTGTEVPGGLSKARHPHKQCSLKQYLVQDSLKSNISKAQTAPDLTHTELPANIHCNHECKKFCCQTRSS